MDARHNTEDRPKGAAVKKRSLWKVITVAAGAAVGLLLLVVLAAPTALSSAGGTRFLLGKINQSVDGQVGLDTFSAGWFSGIKLTNLTYHSDDGAARVTVGRIETHPRYSALIGGRVDLGRTVIDRPQVHLKVPSRPAPATDAAKPASPKRDTPPFVLPVHLIDLEVAGGNATIELFDPEAAVQRVTFKNIASTVVLNEPGNTSRLNLSVDVQNGSQTGSLKAQGEVTPKKGWTLEDTDGTFTVSIAKLELESLRPLLAMAGLDVQTGGVLNAEANIEMRRGVVETLIAEATVDNFSQGIGEQKVVFDEPVRLTAKGGFKNDVLHIDALDVKTPFCKVTCSGGMETLDYAVAADLAQTQQFLKQFTDLGGYGLSGALDLAGRLELSDGATASTGKGTVKNLLVSKDGRRAPQTDVALDYDLALDNRANRLTVASATLTTGPGTVSVQQLSAPMGDAAAGPITLTARTSLDMAKAWPYAQILGGAPTDIALAGLLDAAISIVTQEDVLRLKTDGANIRNLRVAKTGAEPFVQDQVRLTADVTLDTARQSVGVNAFDMQGARGETLIKIIKGKVEQSAADGVKTLDAEIEAEYDLQAISILASPFLPDGLKVQGRRKDRLVLASRWPESEPEKMMAHLNGKGGFGFDRAEYYGLNFGPTDLMIDIREGLAAITIPDTEVNRGKLRFAGTLDLKEDPMFLRLNEPMALLENVGINDVLTAQLLRYVNPVFVGARATSGVANLNCRKLVLPLSSDHRDKMDIDATVGISNLRMQAGDFLGQILTLLNQRQAVEMTLRPTNFLMQNGAVSYRDMQIDLGNYPLNFSGSLGLDKRLRMDVKLPLGMDFRPVRLAEAGAERIEVPLSGTVDSPTIDVARLLQRQGQQLIEDQLRRLFR